MESIVWYYVATSLATSLSAVLGWLVAERCGIESPQYGLAIALSFGLGAIAILATSLLLP